MVLRNADGGLAEMSGNGARALAWVAHRAGIGDGKRLVVDTGGGRREIDLELDPATDAVVHATVDMGPVTFDPFEIPLDAPSPFDLEATFHGTTYRATRPGSATRTSSCSSRIPRRRGSPSTVRASSTTSGSRTAPTSSSSRSAPGESDAITMRVWERGRRRDVVVRHRRVRVGRGRAPSRPRRRPGRRARPRRRPHRRSRRDAPARWPGPPRRSTSTSTSTSCAA